MSRRPISVACPVSSYPYLSRERIRRDLADRGAAVRKSLGQNFLIDPNFIGRLSDHIRGHRTGGFSLIEIGPGLGALTHRLLEFAEVQALEIDRVLAALLREQFGANERFTLIEGDARRTLQGLSAPVVCGNLPYYITTDLILDALQVEGAEELFFLVQSEFARRACAAQAESSFSVYLRNFGEPRLLERVPAGCFYPAPSVESAFFHVRLFSRPICPPSVLEPILRMSYRGKRKKLRNSWSTGHALLSLDVLTAAASSIKLDTEKRPEEIAIDRYHALALEVLALLGSEPGLPGAFS